MNNKKPTNNFLYKKKETEAQSDNPTTKGRVSDTFILQTVRVCLWLQYIPINHNLME